MLFGTDWPVIDPERAVREIAELPIREESRRLLMRDNALRVFDRLPRGGRPMLLTRERTALLVVDVQNGFCHPEGSTARMGLDQTLTIAAVPAASGWWRPRARPACP